jgi:hypothetical protein
LPVPAVLHLPVESGYYVFDTETKTGRIMQNITENPSMIPVKEYVYLDGYRFLGIGGFKRNVSQIVELNLLEGTSKILESFSHNIYHLSKIGDTNFGFVMVADHALSMPNFGGKVLEFLCFWEYNYFL